MSKRPQILDELGRELVGAARADEARRAHDGFRRLPRAVVLALLVLLGFTAIAVAAVLVIRHGSPISTARVLDVPVELRPVAGSARLSRLNVRDPDGGPVWDVRTSRSKTGATCATVGKVHDGEFGLLGLDQRFRALPAGAADTCSRRQASGVTLAGARAFRGGGSLSDLTVVSGVAAANVRSVVTVAGGRTVRTRLGGDHAFLAVLHGVPEGLRPRLVLTAASGRRTTLRFADSGAFLVDDPSRGAAWTLHYSAGRNGLRCVQGLRGLGSNAANVATVPKRCGRRGTAFVATQRFVPRAEDLDPVPSGEVAPVPPFLWRLYPARTVVWGSTTRADSAVVLLGAGAPRRLRLDARRGDDAARRAHDRQRPGQVGFIAVLDGRVDPRRLRVTVDGRRLNPGDALDSAGRPIGIQPVPAWRSVASVKRELPSFEPFVPVPGSATISRRAADPASRSIWALRSWSARRAPGTPSAGSDRDFLCFAVGVEGHRRLLEPLPGDRRRTVGTGVRDARCLGPSELASAAPQPEVRPYVDDAEAPNPRLVRVVVAGLLGDNARSAQLLGAGAPRSLPLGPHGTYLATLGPEPADADLWVRRVDDDSPSPDASRQDPMRSFRCVPTPGLSVRVADPDGGPSWTRGLGRAGGRDCDYVGQLIGDRVATVIGGQNWVLLAPMQAFSATARPRRSDRPLKLNVSDPRSGVLSEADPGAAPSRAQVARRTQAGRTLLMGVARDDVLSVTLRTPRDIRTIRPGPGGLILAVYDGFFYGGQVHASAHLRNGQSITQTVRIGYL